MEPYARDCELVLALVCPVGVNLDDVYTRLTSIFQQFKYDVNWIHLSQLAEGLADNPVQQSANEIHRLDHAMHSGTSLREKYGRGDFMALLAIRAIHERRQYIGESPAPLKRTVHIIRSVKHSDEVETLRQTYGSGFFLLGLSASTTSKKHYLKQLKGVPEEDISRIIDRDDKEDRPLGQQTRDVFELADAYVTTDQHKRLSDQLTRTVDILFSKPVVPPTAGEYAMFMAYAAATRSADLARQVGAVIVNQRGDILSTGANDVPKFEGGLYWPTDGDQRDYIKGFDSNEVEKKTIAEDAIRRILGPTVTDREITQNLDKLKGSKLMGITEYGRAVHAEMEALLQAARNGVSIRGCTLYTTTYPCHNCAKHLVAAGIGEVVYIEPYPKSHAIDLHSDSINDNDAGSDGKVKFTQFVGIGPRRFIDLFSVRLSSGRRLQRKHKGRVVGWSRENAELRVPMLPLSYMDSEVSLIKELAELTKELNDDKAE